MIINRGRKISSLLNKKHPFSGFKLWYFIPLKKIKVKKKIQDIEDFREKRKSSFNSTMGIDLSNSHLLL
jgi:hypothetical protein